MITQVRHCDKFFALYRDFQRVGQRFVRGKRADLFAATLRVLETMRKSQIEFLKSNGRPEEDITEDMLGFPMTWKLFSEGSQRHYSPRSYESIIEKVVESGVAHRCYVECHRRKTEDGEELILVGDERGRPITYATIDEARAQRSALFGEDETLKCSGGDFISYFYFNATAVNDLFKEIYHLSDPPPTPGGPGGLVPGHKNGSAQHVPSGDGHAEQPPREKSSSAQVGNFTTDLSFSREMITQGSQKCEGISPESCQNSQDAGKPSQKGPGGGADGNQGSQNCAPTPRKNTAQGSQNYEGNPRKTASNKNNKEEGLELPEENNSISAGRAIDPLLFAEFDFSQAITPNIILQISRLIYTPAKEAAQAKDIATAQAMAEWPQTRELGLRELVAAMAYQVDESSPCRLRAYCRNGDPARGRPANPGVQMRLNQIKSEMVLYKLHHEREQCDWWPSWLPRAASASPEPPASEVQVIDLAELADIPTDQRQGMTRDAALDLMASIREILPAKEFPNVFVDFGSVARFQRQRGYYVIFSPVAGLDIKMYSHDDWRAVASNAAWLEIDIGEFISNLLDWIFTRSLEINNCRDFRVYEKEVS